MTATLSRKIEVGPPVAAFLKRHAAEAAFQTVCHLVLTHFPESLNVSVSVLDDPDEDHHQCAVLQVQMPAAYPLDLLQNQRGQYHADLADQLSVDLLPIFGLMIDFAEADGRLGRKP